MEKGRIKLSISFLELGEILNKMAMFKYFIQIQPVSQNLNEIQFTNELVLGKVLCNLMGDI